jgi:GSH-dependent disulfide-bond oxidoreductase
MIDLYTWPTPNGFKASIMLEEVGLPYDVHAINILAGDQFEADFLKISPNNRIPAIVDPDGPDREPFSLFESGAILMYLAEKTGKFMPTDPIDRYSVIQWLMFQMGGVGPMFGQANHFRKYAPDKIDYAIDRYSKEAERLYGVMDRRLADVEFLAETYSIADMACFPWVRSYEKYGDDLLEKFPNLKRWMDTIEARPAVQAGLAVLSEHVSSGPITDEARENFFGEKQFQRK